MKRILRYLNGTWDYRLWYKKNEKFELKVYIDVDRAKNVDDRKSASGGTLSLGKRLISWKRKRKNCISESTIEAKYVVVVVNYSNIVWIKQLLKGI